ncbi:MAG: putative quinol monooxygenase [Jatrophihabitantaceae bacterium]
MSEISTVAIITAKPGSAEQVEQALQTLAEGTHAEEGCLHYSLHRGLQDPNVFVTIEKWRSQEDLDTHAKSAHIAAAFATMGEHLAGRPTIVPATPLAVGDPTKGTF